MLCVYVWYHWIYAFTADTICPLVCVQLPSPFDSASSARKEKDTVIALGEYVESLSRAPVGGAANPVDGTGLDATGGAGGYLMSFSVINIFRFGPEWRKVYTAAAWAVFLNVVCFVF